MSGHLTRQPSSWRNWFLSKFGLTDLPTPVNCWYCNQTMYLLPGSKQTERHWHCNLCENTNVIDEFGDIMDAPPLPDTAFKYGYGLSQERQKTNKLHASISSGSSNPRTLCDSCQSNQTLIYQIMSDYIRDESDPDYDYYVETADSRQQSLHAKYPLCDNCQRKIQDMVADHILQDHRRRINEQRQRSLHTKTPTRPTSNQYRVQGLFWFIVHLSVLFLCIFAIFYPPQPLSHKTVIAPVWNWLLYTSDYVITLLKRNGEEHTTVLSMSTPYTLTNDTHYPPFLALLMNALMFIAIELRDTICFVYYAFHKLVFGVEDSMENSGQEIAQHFWDVTNIGITCYAFFYGSSLYFMNWHYKASRTFLGISKPLYWKNYQVIQAVLYFSRLAFLYSLGFMSFTSNVTIWVTFLNIYFLLLLSSVCFVRVKKQTESNGLSKKFVFKRDEGQEQQKQQKQQPDCAQNRQLLRPPYDASSSRATTRNIDLPIPLGSTELKETRNSSWYTAPLKLLSRQQCDNEDEVDGLTSELGRISV